MLTDAVVAGVERDDEVLMEAVLEAPAVVVEKAEVVVAVGAVLVITDVIV